MDLPTLWYLLIAVLWLGYLFLEGFDLGVGMLLGGLAHDERDRRTMINTIGPVWDGNEVWLITAIGATFAAFPHWYASLLSALYLPMVLVVLALIFRAAAFEWRGKHDSDRWRAWWTGALRHGSLVVAFGIGQALAATTLGIPLDVDGNRVGGPWAGLRPITWIGGVAVVAFALAHGAIFVSLKTDGDLRRRARTLAMRLVPVGTAPLLAWAGLVLARHDDARLAVLVVPMVAAAAVTVGRLRAGREGQAFAAWSVMMVSGMAAIFGAAYPVVLPTTLAAGSDLTVTTASVSDYTLTVMTWVTVVALPVVLAYQAWTYWVFRKRISGDAIPPVHTVRRLPLDRP